MSVVSSDTEFSPKTGQPSVLSRIGSVVFAGMTTVVVVTVVAMTAAWCIRRGILADTGFVLGGTDAVSVISVDANRGVFGEGYEVDVLCVGTGTRQQFSFAPGEVVRGSAAAPQEDRWITALATFPPAPTAADLALAIEKRGGCAK